MREGLVIDYENGVKFTFNFCLFGQNAGPEARQMVLAGTQAIMEQSDRGKVVIRKQGSREAEVIDTTTRTPSAVTAREVGPDQDMGTYREYLAFANSIRTGEKSRHYRAMWQDAGPASIAVYWWKNLCASGGSLPGATCRRDLGKG